MNSRDTSAHEPVTLENCDSEPIHVPGLIQPHGALLAFAMDGSLVAWSENLLELLGLTPALGQSLGGLALNAEVTHAVRECMNDGSDSTPLSLETVARGQQFDVVVHQHAGRVIVEFETRVQPSDEVAAFALKAHRATDRLRRQRTANGLLQTAVEQIRIITGFDRVMAYRFRYDDSGDIVAEARDEALEPYLGRRYPATDIPAQARRLYTLNTLRLIGDTNYKAVAVLGRSQDAPLDMSHSVLRSVSPIHIEYLQNMGVAASMSISIVVNGKLWGMLACHHGQPKRVPYPIRMACDLLAQVIAATVQSMDAVVVAEQAAEAAVMRTRLLEALLEADDIVTALSQHMESLRASLRADAVVICHQGKILTCGNIPQSLTGAIVNSLPTGGGDLAQRNNVHDWPEDIRPHLGVWAGLLGLCFDPVANGWLLLLRVEQVETVNWGGRPEKVIQHGPRGPRLTPRGSFEVWQETVRGVAEPWGRIELGNARQLLGEMHRASNARYAELERTRTQLLAMLGHDLRDPLNSISMAAHVLQRGELEQKLGNRIQASSGRMQRLISQVLDVSRVQNGLGLGMSPSTVDLAKLIEDMVDETQTAHPQTVYEAELPATLLAPVDGDRISQLISNLLNNAHHHGDAGRPIHISLQQRGNQAVIQVRNFGQPIPESIATHLFSPFKRQIPQNNRNRSGMGLGLYIAHAIVMEHGGSIRYDHESPQVVFTISLPLPEQVPAA